MNVLLDIQVNEHSSRCNQQLDITMGNLRGVKRTRSEGIWWRAREGAFCYRHWSSQKPLCSSVWLDKWPYSHSVVRKKPRTMRPIVVWNVVEWSQSSDRKRPISGVNKDKSRLVPRLIPISSFDEKNSWVKEKNRNPLHTLSYFPSHMSITVKWILVSAKSPTSRYSPFLT
jgi:hypothetical protein